jgi:hypothetical protein
LYAYPSSCASSRPWVEVFFEYEKDLQGNDHYQVLSRQAILRFWTLTACLFAFLETQPAAAEAPNLTCGDVRRRLQKEHQRNLLSIVRGSTARTRA